MQILRAADRKAQPWKNGGGLTREIAVFPASAGMDDFEWRISAATVAAAGPFSRFDGAERTLLVTEGKGMRLAVEGLAPVVLTPESPPFSFAGDAAAMAELVDGPIADLNVMTRRGAWTAEVQRRATPATVTAETLTMVIPLGETLGDATLLEAGETVALKGEGQIAVIGLRSTR